MASTPPSLKFPPLDYSLLFPDLINFHMERNPRFPIFAYANESGIVTQISCLEFGRAAHRVAHALRPSRQGPDGEVVMMIANTDTILYHAALTGLSIAGWVPFPVSHRNSATAIVDMMKKTNCSHVVSLDRFHKGLIDDIRRENGGDHLKVHELPTLRYTFPKLGNEVAADSFVPYPPPLIRPDLDSPAIYLHSSGSTGIPKPIPHSHRLQIQWMRQPLIRLYCELAPPRRMGSMALPPFHTLGVVTQLHVPIACLATAVVYPPRTDKDPLAQPVIPTNDNMIECLKSTQCNVFFAVPAFLEQMVKSEEAIEILKKVAAIRYGGGPLPVKVGEALWAAGVRLANCYGATEISVPAAMPNDQDVAEGDWMWLRFADDLKLRWAPQGDDTYELQILSTEDRTMAVENMPDVKGYATADIFMKHPTKDMWRVVGRADDVITLVSGEKTVPAPMESIIGSSPLVQGVVMFGRERNQVGILIEPGAGHSIDVNDGNAVAEFRNQIWPTVEEANKLSPAFSRIFKETILVTSVNKPMLRAAKGTVQRKATLKIYEAEIDALYNMIEASSVAPDGPAGPSAWTSDVLEEWLLEHARSISPDNRAEPHSDLFSQGFDSLSATYLRNRLLGALRRSSDPVIRQAAAHIPPNIIFENPNIQLLSSRIMALVSGNVTRQEMNSTEKHKKAINAMIEKYSAGLDEPVDGVLPSRQPIEPTVVLITGTTGGLGSSLLSELLRSPAVRRVFAFNRPSPVKLMEERQKLSFIDRGLSVELLDLEKLEYVEADASLEKCGLPPAQYEEIRNSVTLIIHNAWRLDFNLTISSFEENIRASRNLIDLGLDSAHKENLRFLFTSSVSSAQSWDNSNGPFPEEVHLDPSVAIGTGYGEGKYVTERIIVKSGLHATSLRIGQIAGGVGGSWTTTDWFPILVKSSIVLGALPETVGVISWLRKEQVTSAILEVAFAKEATLPVLNIVNPRGAAWADIIAVIRRAIIRRKGLGDDLFPIVPFGDWFSLLEKRAKDASEGDLIEIPALKMLAFFRRVARHDEATRQRLGVVTTEQVAGTVNWSTAKAQRVSPTMAEMRAIGEVEANAWVGYWMSKGAF